MTKFKIEYKKNKMKYGFIGMNYPASQELHVPFNHKSNVIEIWKTSKPVMKETEKHEEIELKMMQKGLNYHQAHKIALKHEGEHKSIKNIMKEIKHEKIYKNCFGILIILSLILLIPIISAQNDNIGIVKQNNCITISQSSNCTFENVSNVLYPDKITMDSNIVLSNNGNSFFSYSFCNTSQTGQYIVNGYDCYGNWAYDFQVTVTGNSLDTSKSISYVIIFVISFLIFLGLLIMGIMLPSKNDSDEMTGYIIAVSNLKYFKLLCLGLAYLVALFISYFSWNITTAYLDISFVSTIFKFISIGLTVTIFPLFVVMVYMLIANLIKDQKLNELLSRGLRVKGD